MDQLNTLSPEDLVKQAKMAQTSPHPQLADVADGEEQYVEAFKRKMDEAVEGSMQNSKVQATPLDQVLEILQVPLTPPPHRTQLSRRIDCKSAGAN